jgi:benzoate-CoA ligase
MLAETNFAAWIIDINADKQEKLALVDDQQGLTYRQLSHHIRCFARHLLDLGLLPQQRVIIKLDDSVSYPVAFLSCIYAGLNPVLVSNDMLETGVRRIIEISDAVAIITNDNANFGIKHVGEHEILQATNPEVIFYKFHRDEMCFWMLSSGSSGQPKCIVHRHANLYNILTLVAKSFDIDQNSKILSTAKMSWAYGLNCTVTYALGSGATSYMFKGISAPTKIFNRIDSYDITHFFTVPTLIASMIKHGKGRGLNKTLRRVVSAGEPMPLNMYESFQKEFGVCVLDCIGMAEVTQIYTWHDPALLEPGTIGRPMPGVLCELRNPDGTVTDVGKIGEMYIKSPAQAMLYWKDRPSTCHTFLGEWVRSGDQMIQTKLGNFKYLARNDDLIKIQGSYVAATEVESTIMSMQEVEECAVVAQSQDNNLPELYAFVVLNKNITATDIQQYLKNKLAKHKIPKHFRFVETLPKTLTNKTIRHILRKEILC